MCTFCEGRKATSGQLAEEVDVWATSLVTCKATGPQQNQWLPSCATARPVSGALSTNRFRQETRPRLI